MAPEDATQQTPPNGEFEPNLDPNVNKTEATHQLLAEWTRLGKPTRSNVDLLAELTRRYPRANFTTAIVAQAKQRLKSQESGTDKRPAKVPAPAEPLAVPPPARPNAAAEVPEFMRQLRDLVRFLGKEEVKKLIDNL